MISGTTAQRQGQRGLCFYFFALVAYSSREKEGIPSKAKRKLKKKLAKCTGKLYHKNSKIGVSLGILIWEGG